MATVIFIVSSVAIFFVILAGIAVFGRMNNYIEEEQDNE